MGADKSAENTPNAPEFICPSPKVLDFNQKKPSLRVRSPWTQTSSLILKEKSKIENMGRRTSHLISKKKGLAEISNLGFEIVHSVILEYFIIKE